MIEASAVIRETPKYQHRWLHPLVKVKTIYYFTNYIIGVMKADIFAPIAIEKALKRPKMRSFEGARRRREKIWGILRVWEKN